MTQNHLESKKQKNTQAQVPKPAVSPTPPAESSAEILAHFLKFLGLLMSAGGSLTITLRSGWLQGKGSQNIIFLAVMTLLGIILWAVGWSLAAKARQQKIYDSEKTNSHHNQARIQK